MKKPKAKLPMATVTERYASQRTNVSVMDGSLVAGSGVPGGGRREAGGLPSPTENATLPLVTYPSTAERPPKRRYIHLREVNALAIVEYVDRPGQ